MNIAVECPNCGHINMIEINTRHPMRVCCDDAQDGGCGDYFGVRIRTIVDTYKRVIFE